MLTSDSASPTIAFDDWRAEFPERGRHSFLPAADPRAAVDGSAPDGSPGLWLVRAESGLAIVIPQRVPLRRGADRVHGLAVLHHGDEVWFGESRGRFSEIRRVTVEAGSGMSGRRCPHCRAHHTPGAEILRCPLCGEGYCLDCWDILVGRRCCSRNCRFSPATLIMQVAS